MPFLYEDYGTRQTKNTFREQNSIICALAGIVVVWPPTDQLAQDLVRTKFPSYRCVKVYWNDPNYLESKLLDQDGNSYPIEPEPLLITDNNLILIGGDSPNPYSKKYFTDTGIIKVDTEKETMIGPGVYANGKRVITTIKRENGTTVTLICGWKAIDTFYAVQDFLGIGRPSALQSTLVPIASGALGFGLGCLVTTKRKP